MHNPAATPRLLLQLQQSAGRGGDCAIIGADGSDEPPVTRCSVREEGCGVQAEQAFRGDATKLRLRKGAFWVWNQSELRGIQMLGRVQVLLIRSKSLA